MMATVDMNLVQIYRLSVNPHFRWQKQIASSHINGRPVRAITSLSQAALPRNSNYDSTNGYDESDDDLPSLKELSRSAWTLNTSKNASNTERPL